MARLLLISLGGTIACVKTRRGLTPSLKAVDLLSSVRVPADMNVEGLDLFKETALLPRHWVALSRSIFRKYRDYDGFVVTLGTDTLAYVACALSLMLKGLGKPVVLTGAMEIAVSPRPDGPGNVRDALHLAAQPHWAGVWVVFNGGIYAGSSVSKVRCDSRAAFESINARKAGRISGGRIPMPRGARRTRTILQLCAQMEERVILIKLTPALKPSFFRSLAEYRGIVIEGYGDGNVQDVLVAPLAELARRKVLVLASHCLFGRLAHLYEGGAALIRAGACSAGTMTKEMAFVKLMWALGARSDREGALRLFRGRE